MFVYFVRPHVCLSVSVDVAFYFKLGFVWGWGWFYFEFLGNYFFLKGNFFVILFIFCGGTLLIFV